MGIASVSMVIVTVALGRALLEMVLAGKPSEYTPIHIINITAFYLEAFSLYALVASRATNSRIERVSGLVAVGVFMGLFPPIIDTVLLGPGHGHYAYFVGPFSEWHFSLFDERFASNGEGITVWLTILMVCIYVFEVTHSPWRVVSAALGAYAAVTILAALPLNIAGRVYPELRRAWGGTNDFFTTVVIAIQLVVAQTAYVAARPGLALRLIKRVVHIAPFVMLVYLGGQMRRIESDLARLLLDHPLPLLMAALGIFQIGLVSVVQNDAYDTSIGKGSCTITSDDAYFFTMVGILFVLSVVVIEERAGLLLGLALLGSIVYNSPAYAAKRRFPANQKIEGLWAWCSYCIGGYSHPKLVEPASVSFLIVSFLVFGGWSLFSAFKDYKDIRTDYKLHNQTIYTIAIRKGVSLKKVHRGFVLGLTIGLLVLLGMVFFYLGACWLLLLPLATTCLMIVVALGPPKHKTVCRFITALTAHAGAIAFTLFQTIGG